MLGDLCGWVAGVERMIETGVQHVMGHGVLGSGGYGTI